MPELIDAREAKKINFDKLFSYQLETTIENGKEVKHVIPRSRVYKPISFEEVLLKAESEGIISLNSQEIVENFKQVLINCALMKMEFTRDLNIDAYLKGYIYDSINAINNFFNDSESIFDTLMYVMENDPLVVMEHVENITEKRKKDMQSKLDSIYSKCIYIYNNHPEFAKMFGSLRNIIEGMDESIVYNLIAEEVTIHKVMNKVVNMPFKQIDAILDYINLEVDILNKFKEEEILQFIRSIPIGKEYMNICEGVLYNYIWNQLSNKDIISKPSILIDFDMANNIILDVNNHIYTEKDAIDIIENGPIKFSEEEKNYLCSRLIPHFTGNFVDNEYAGMCTETDVPPRKIKF